jgi:hypothetical protein
MSETDDTGPRRPPTIELEATEVENDKPAADAAAGERAATEESAQAAAGGRGATEESAQAEAPSPIHTGSPRLGQLASALIGAAATAAALAVLWFAGVIPAREGAQTHADTHPATDQASTGQGSANVPAPTATSQPPRPEAATSPAPNDASATEVKVRLDKLERAIDTQRDNPANSSAAALEAQVKSLSDTLAALQKRLDDIAATGQSAAKQADAALGAASAAKSASEASNKTEVPRSDFDAVTAHIAALENAVKGLTALTAPLASGVNDRAARLAAAAEALRAAVERGGPYQPELDAVRALGVEQKAVALLESFAATGIPGAAAMARELTDLMPALEAAAEPAPRDANFLDRLKSNAEKLVRITPADAPLGNDPATVVARIGFAAAHNDVAAAAADADALPDSARPLLAAWVKKAAAREAALAAARNIATGAVAALGKSPAR